MRRVIDLSGRWMLFGTDEHGEKLCVDAEVPGCVHTDLINAGIVDEG